MRVSAPLGAVRNQQRLLDSRFRGNDGAAGAGGKAKMGAFALGAGSRATLGRPPEWGSEWRRGKSECPK